MEFTEKNSMYITAFNQSSLKHINDDDTIVLMDAYDVIVNAPIVHISRALTNASSPIIFCAENGIYPDSAGDVIYIITKHS